MMIRNCIVFFALIFIFSCSSSGRRANHNAYKIRIYSFENNLNNIPGYVFKKINTSNRNAFKSKTLKLLVLNSLNTYWIYNGIEYGLEYELLRLYAADRKMTIEMSVVTDMKSFYDSLQLGNFDLATGTLIKCKMYDSLYPQSRSLYETDIVVVQRKIEQNGKPRKLITRIEDLPAHSVGVVDNSSVLFKLNEKKALRYTQYKKIGMANSREGLIEMVAAGTLDYAVVNRHEALILSALYPNLDYSLSAYPRAQCAVFINPYSKGMSKDFNSWVKHHKRTTDYAWIVMKYDSLYDHIRDKYNYKVPIVKAGTISKFDQLILKYAQELGWDWRLLAAQIFQESKFDPDKKSWMGAVGLMQIMPIVGSKYGGVSSSHLINPEVNIKTGVAYIKWLYGYYDRDTSISKEEKLKFVLAAYNAGVGHVQDARALAMKYGYDPSLWNGNVEVMMMNKSKPLYYRDRVCQYGYCRGAEPVQYVKNILMYFQHYSNVVKH